MTWVDLKKIPIEKTFKPFDVVQLPCGSVSMVSEVSINQCQPDVEDQIKYSLIPLVGPNTVTAWFQHHELKYCCNIMLVLAQQMCHPHGQNRSHVKTILNIDDTRPTLKESRNV